MARSHLAAVRGAVQAQEARILDVGRFIHSNPELAFREFEAAARIAAYLADLGFDIEMPYGGLATGLRASIKGKGRGPVIAVLAEYDALAGLGHGCGHNLITVAAIAAAAGVAGRRGEWPGRFEIIGTPGEELLVGKCRMARSGAFDHLDACFMAHPGDKSVIATGANALRIFSAAFGGKAAHAAAAPQEGINALDAAILAFNSINSLRQHLREDARVHGIITNGGQALNVIPELVEVRMGVRAADEAYLAELGKRVERAFRSAARAVGAKVSIRWDRDWYRPLRTNWPLVDILVESCGRAGIGLRRSTGRECRASLDIGNVSQIAPAAHPFFNIFPEGGQSAALHTREFLRQAATPHAFGEAIKAGVGMAMAALRLLTDRDALKAVKSDFARTSNR